MLLVYYLITTGVKLCCNSNSPTETSDSTGEMLDSETEPCLMMEHVLEDVVVPDGHSHNMISSGHSLTRLTHSESLNNLSQAILNRQLSEQDGMKGSFMSDTSAAADFCHPVTLVDQVIEVDNVITRLLKVIPSAGRVECQRSNCWWCLLGIADNPN